MLTLLKSTLKWTAICACLVFAPFTHAQFEGDPDPGYTFVKEAGLVQELNLSQTQGDLTATVESFYADENRIIVAYNLVAPDDSASRNFEVDLTDASGSPYELYPNDNPTHTRESLVASFRVGYNYLAEMSPFIFTINYSEDIVFEFEIEAEVHFAVRVVWDMHYEAATVNMHLYEMSVSPSMTVTTFCFIRPAGVSWTPQGTISSVEGTMALRAYYSFILIEYEPCIDVYAYIPYDFDGTVEPMSITIDRLATPRLQTLENMRNLQTRAEEIGISVEIINMGDPVGYQYTASETTPEFVALVDEMLYEHIDGPWLFQLGGLP
jgi:hypothetical protein